MSIHKRLILLPHLLLSGATYLSFNKRSLQDTSKGKGTCLKRQNIYQNHSLIWQSSWNCQTMNKWPVFKGTSGKNRQHEWKDNISTVMETPMRFEREMLEMGRKMLKDRRNDLLVKSTLCFPKRSGLVTSIHIQGSQPDFVLSLKNTSYVISIAS